MIKEVVINSYPRTGNTFMSYALRSAYELNGVAWERYPIISHTHSKYLQRLKNDKNFYQISIVRNPIDTISSFVVHFSFSDGVDLQINENLVRMSSHCSRLYLEFYSEWLINKNATMISFEKMKDEPNKVINLIFDEIGLNYFKYIDPDHVLKTLRESDTESNSGIWTGHTPRDVESLKEYQIVKNFIISTDQYKECLDVYNKIMEELK
jgi:hypothetical protein